MICNGGRGIRKLFASVCAVGVVFSFSISAYALSVANGELQYDGGQTSSIVYSTIFDSKPTNNMKYKVKATVTVGSNKTTSDWQDDYAHAEAYRSFWSNERSYYDYYLR
ncbi:hypothetical protein [Ectobacillus antri]|uniref:hypothetical protein n=1 Tax=Ectobacillus antri TaxID=2486280 RepID=UPI000F5AEB55|nr:hypothetical protein [Ectobacillus antri]